jgi:hypothetical protein
MFMMFCVRIDDPCGVDAPTTLPARHGSRPACAGARRGWHESNERNKFEPIITFAGIFDALEPDRPLLEVLSAWIVHFAGFSQPSCPACTAPIAAAATADQEAQVREDARFCWLAAPVPLASLPASFIQQAPSG